MENEKKYFAGANTSLGFYNLFNNIIDNSKESFLYILKGGPGTGKSTLMKKVAKHFLLKGEEVECFYCSSDSASLDGVRIVSKNIAIVDGTAPHLSNPKIIGITDKIINLGDYIKDDILSCKDVISKLTEEKSNHFKIAYNYLGIAGNLYKTNNILLQEYVSDGLVNNEISKILTKYNLNRLNKKGMCRELFLNVFEKTDSDFINQNYSNILYVSNNQLLNELTFNKLKGILIDFGYDVIDFKNLLNPSSTDAIYIKEIDKLIKRKDYIFPTKQIKANQREIDNAISNAIKSLEDAKSKHLEMEKYYISHMDFQGIDSETNKLLNTLDGKIK